MARPFDHDLNAGFPGGSRPCAERLQFRELRVVAGVGEASRSETVAEAERHVVLGEDGTDFLELDVQRVLHPVFLHPLGEDRPATRDDARLSTVGERQVLHQHARVDGHVIDALPGLLCYHVEQEFGRQVGHVLDARNRLVNRNGSDWNRRVFDVRLPDFVQIATRTQIHHGVGPVVDCGVELPKFTLEVARRLAVADVRVDLRGEFAADNHRVERLVVVVGRNDGLPICDLFADEFRRSIFALGDSSHRRREFASTGALKLCLRHR